MSSVSNKASEHLDKVSIGEDKNNARDFLSGKILVDIKRNETNIQIDGKLLKLPGIKKGKEDILKKLIETLIVEKSVCEARLYLLAECKAEVSKKSLTPTYDGPDIKFSDSFFRGSRGIMRYEDLQKIFDINSVHPIAKNITEFINLFPENYIPIQIIESPLGITSAQK